MKATPVTDDAKVGWLIHATAFYADVLDFDIIGVNPHRTIGRDNQCPTILVTRASTYSALAQP
ncbi:MAG: hypothetical protein ABI171_17240 [Collimonas sp.]|uniref:hypothetical protein n=1 Tax=Collimonas sp. TaxID=1963772 RepID=UPI003266C26C